VGKVGIRKLESYGQDDPDAYSYSGGLCQDNQGLLVFVEIFKAPIRMLHPLLTATQEANYKGTEGFSAIPFQGIKLAHSKESEWQSFRNNGHNEGFLNRVYRVKVPYCLQVSEEVRIYGELQLSGGSRKKIDALKKKVAKPAVPGWVRLSFSQPLPGGPAGQLGSDVLPDGRFGIDDRGEERPGHALLYPALTVSHSPAQDGGTGVYLPNRTRRRS
jgi:hypothetical protein